MTKTNYIHEVAIEFIARQSRGDSIQGFIEDAHSHKANDTGLELHEFIYKVIQEIEDIDVMSDADTELHVMSKAELFSKGARGTLRTLRTRRD